MVRSHISTPAFRPSHTLLRLSHRALLPPNRRRHVFAQCSCVYVPQLPVYSSAFTPLQPDVFLTSEDLLITFDNAAYDDPDVALAVQVLTVRLHNPFPLDVLRRSLAAPIFITDLIIFLPLNTTPVILNNLLFPRLELFKTNLPHRFLVHFLSLHPSLTNLCLDACGRVADEACPLDCLDLQHISTVECPIGCVHGVAHPDVFRLTAQMQHPGEAESPAILTSIPAPFKSLFTLTLDIFPDNYDILRSVVFAAPRVRVLKLLEHPRAPVSLIVPEVPSSSHTQVRMMDPKVAGHGPRRRLGLLSWEGSRTSQSSPFGHPQL